MNYWFYSEESDPQALAIKQGLLQNHLYLISQGGGRAGMKWFTCENLQEAIQKLEDLNDPTNDNYLWFRCEKLRMHSTVTPLVDAVMRGEDLRYLPFNATYVEYKRIKENLSKIR